MERTEKEAILLVDDEAAYHPIVRALIARWDIGFVGVRDAPAAFQAVRSARFRLIFMDIDMAGINGFRGTAHIRSSTEWTRDVPIIAFTAHHPPTGERHFLERGFDGWLAKPFTANAFIDLLARVLGPATNAGPGEQFSADLRNLLGPEQARNLEIRLHDRLSEAVDAIDAGADPRLFAHNLGGLAGTIGLPALGAAWMTLSEGNKGAWQTVRALSLEAISAAQSDNAMPARLYL